MTLLSFEQPENLCRILCTAFKIRCKQLQIRWGFDGISERNSLISYRKRML